MYAITRPELKVLLAEQSSPHISIFLPTLRAGRERRQGRLLLKQLLREMKGSPSLEQLALAEQETLLEPVQALLEERPLWEHPANGLAILRSPNVFRLYRLPYGPQARVIIGEHFFLKPLLPLAGNDERFYILALSQNHIRLLACTRYEEQKVHLPKAVPKNLARVLAHKRRENDLQYHSGTAGSGRVSGGQAMIFHGQGVGTDTIKDDILSYFQQINHGLHAVLHDQKAPLVLAAVDYLQPLYQEANTYPFLLEQGLAGNPDKLSDEELRELAWPLVEPSMLQEQKAAAAAYQELAGTERTSQDLGEIARAASTGRVMSLFIASDEELWGIFDATTMTLDVHSPRRVGDEELLGRMAAQVLLHDGAVYAVRHAEIPGGALAAAIFRY